MPKYREACPGVFEVGGDGLSSPEDCCVYLVVSQEEAVLIDCGAGRSVATLLDNVKATGIELTALKRIVITHGHIDHIGGLRQLKDLLQAEVVAHQLELPAIEQGLPYLTAAAYYGVDYQPVTVDTVLTGAEQTLSVGELSLVCLHTPGHTAGGISVYLDGDQGRVLFGQDIHGPFSAEWGSDLRQWRQSMQKLIDLQADVLCEGHYGIIRGQLQVRRYIEQYLQRYH